MRDAQKARVYRAEDNVRYRGGVGITDQFRFTDSTEAQLFLDTVIRPKLGDRDRRPDHPITVRTQVKGEHCWYRNRWDRSFIDLLPGWGYTGLVLCHEYAHHLAKPTPAPPHSADWVRELLAVTEAVYSDDTSERLRKAYDAAKVIWRPDDQVRAARNQVLRLRSDCGATAKNRWSSEFIPFTYVVWAEDESDFAGRTYQIARAPRVEVQATFGEGLDFDDWGEATHVEWRQLRYVEAPMVRVR